MSLAAAITGILPSVPILDDTNWFVWSKKFKMFFIGAGVPQVTTGAQIDDTKLKAEFDKINSQLLAFVYTKVSDDYQYLVEDCNSASAAWTSLKKHFEKSTMGHRMAARREFYNIHHDSSLPISQYIQSVTAARAKLTAFGVTIEDSEFIDVLLMNIHESFHQIRASILMEASEPSPDRIKSMLTGSAAATDLVSIKQESSSPSLAAYRANVLPGGRGGKGAGGSGLPAGRVDSKGYTWGDVTNPDGCHCCGRPGHIAARCMYSMPEHVKEWIMHGSGARSHSRSRSRSPHRARVAMEHAGSANATLTPAFYLDDPAELAAFVEGDHMGITGSDGKCNVSQMLM